MFFDNCRNRDDWDIDEIKDKIVSKSQSIIVKDYDTDEYEFGIAVDKIYSLPDGFYYGNSVIQAIHKDSRYDGFYDNKESYIFWIDANKKEIEKAGIGNETKLIELLDDWLGGGKEYELVYGCYLDSIDELIYVYYRYNPWCCALEKLEY